LSPLIKRQTFIPILLGGIIGISTFYPFTYTNTISMNLIGGIKRNQWVTHFDLSMENQNPWLRNYIAFIGLLGSIRPEVIYLETMKDDENERLSGDNDYILSGFPPNSRYWSFVIYDFENRRIEPFEETVANSYRTPIQKTGLYEIILTDHPENYPGKIAINHGGANFSIIMRIYGPNLKYYTDKESIPVGRIKKGNHNG
tara:strand:+ start:461 stop:1060 length:600 start_codon:yes stop_codon:yes gene_type:complete